MPRQLATGTGGKSWPFQAPKILVIPVPPQIPSPGALLGALGTQNPAQRDRSPARICGHQPQTPCAHTPLHAASPLTTGEKAICVPWRSETSIHLTTAGSGGFLPPPLLFKKGGEQAGKASSSLKSPAQPVPLGSPGVTRSLSRLPAPVPMTHPSPCRRHEMEIPSHRAPTLLFGLSPPLVTEGLVVLVAVLDRKGGGFAGTPESGWGQAPRCPPRTIEGHG